MRETYLDTLLLSDSTPPATQTTGTWTMPFNTAARDKIDVGKVRRQWPDMLRIIGSIYTGPVRTHDVTRMLDRDSKRTTLGGVIANYGRIQKTLHIFRLPDDEAYRRRG